MNRDELGVPVLTPLPQLIAPGPDGKAAPSDETNSHCAGPVRSTKSELPNEEADTHRQGDDAVAATGVRGEIPHGPKPTGQTYYPPPHHPAWTAFLDGYLAGVTHGIGLGRAQVDQEHADATTFPDQAPRTASYEATRWAADGLSRAEWIARRNAERTAARTDYCGPSLSAEQIRENAFRSWGLIDLDRWNAA